MLVVKLTASEWKAACSLGEKRLALKRERQGSAYRSLSAGNMGGSDERRNHIGSASEYALARHYGKTVLQDWCENKSFSVEHHLILCDVGRALHVRATEYPTGGLTAFKHDKDTGPYVLATVNYAARVVTFVGWCRLDEARLPEYWMTRWVRPCYCAPQSVMRPMDTIPPEAVW
jgi:hypothetical protein